MTAKRRPKRKPAARKNFVVYVGGRQRTIFYSTPSDIYNCGFQAGIEHQREKIKEALGVYEF
jgi:hypothetical protein